MKLDMVVDVGNTRIKWGQCGLDAVARSVSLPPDGTEAWAAQLTAWQVSGPLTWAVSGSHPRRRDSLIDWLKGRGQRVWLLEASEQLPLKVAVPHPNWVGIDRLLNAVAVNSRRERGTPAVVADAGSAVTVDWVDSEGVFAGGTIFPGLRLMANALHDYTALLPVVEIQTPIPPLPGTSTRAAMEAGVYYAVVGGIHHLISLLAAQSPQKPAVFLTGGDAALLLPGLEDKAIWWPHMTLEGMRLSAEAQP